MMRNRKLRIRNQGGKEIIRSQRRRTKKADIICITEKRNEEQIAERQKAEKLYNKLRQRMRNSELRVRKVRDRKQRNCIIN